jgi:chromate transporter
VRYLELIITFIKIGACSFGGGYAMIPFFEKEIAIHNWAPMGDYVKVIALAQIIPGPFAIDSSAYIGYKVGGILGALIASAALSLPSFLALILISRFYFEFKSNNYIQLALNGVRPAVIGLLISAVYIIGIKPIFTAWNFSILLTLLKAVLIIIPGFLLFKHTKINPIIFILIFGVIGIIVF